MVQRVKLLAITLSVVVAKMSKGFTLIELLIVIAIMSMTIAIGLPSFQSIIASTRLTSATNAMVSALQLARFEALKQHKTVVVTKNTSWQNGWIVFVDANGNNVQDTTETTLSSFDKLNDTITTSQSSVYANYVRYSPNGRVNIGGHFTFCSNTDYRSVVIAATGRIRVETPASCS